jgi:MFS transporter, DHA2 family, methylenomycin A resistance protein
MIDEPVPGSTGTPGRRPAGAALAAAAIGFFVLTLDAQVVTVAVPVVGVDLRAGVTELQWVVSGYTLVLAALLLSGGTLGDRLGARRSCAVALGAFMAASAVCGAAPSIAVLIAARLVQGAAAALLLPASLALVRRAHPEPRARIRALALWTAAGGAAMAAGPVIGGALTSALGWRSVFLVNLPVGAVALILLARGPATPAARRRLDVPGQLAATAAMVALTYAVIELDPLALAAGVVAVLVFLLVEHRSADPVLPLQLIASRAVATPVLVGSALNATFYGPVFLVSLDVELGHGLSALAAGVAFLPMTALIAVANLVGGRLVERVGPRVPVLTGQTVLLAGVLGLLLVRDDTPVPLLAAALLPIGVGAGLAVPALTAMVLEAVPAERAGVAAGLLNAGRQFGGTMGVAAGGALAAGTPLLGLHRLALVGACVLAAAIAMAGLRSAATSRLTS